MNNTVSNMNAVQQMFQVALATLDNFTESTISMKAGSLTMSLETTRGQVSQLRLTNGTRTRTWFFMWKGGESMNAVLRTWMLDTLELWDALDAGLIPQVALTDDDLDTIDPAALLELENEIVGTFADDEAAFRMWQSRLNVKMQMEWDQRDDSHWNAGDGLLPTGEHRDSM